MSEQQLAGVLAALSFPIIQEVDPADAPVDEAELYDRVDAWLEHGTESSPRPADQTVEGVGYGLSALDTLELCQWMLEILLNASVHLGLLEIVHRYRETKGGPHQTIPARDIDKLLERSIVLHAELAKHLVILGVEQGQAEALASLAIKGLTNLTTSAKPSPPEPRD